MMVIQRKKAELSIKKSTCVFGVMSKRPCKHTRLMRLHVIHHIVVGFRIVVALMTVPVHPSGILSEELHWIKKTKPTQLHYVH